jgi:hypothetical protein
MVAVGLLIALMLAPATPAGAADPPTKDPLTFETADGDHKLKLSLVSRFRNEWWNAHNDTRTGPFDAAGWSSFWALRTRVAAKYSFKKFVTLFTEFQDARIYGLDNRSTGAAGLYRRWTNHCTPPTFTGCSGRHFAVSDKFRQFWIEVRPVEALSLKVGAQDIKLGTEVMYPEANWRYVKIARGSQRLVGTVGWTHAERTNNAAVASYDFGDYFAYAFGASPTQGVFDLPNAYLGNHKINYGGVTLTAKRGVLLENTEVRPFFLSYTDRRNPASGGLPNGNVRVHTLGASLIGIYPKGPGNVDVLLWGAWQWGDWPGSTPGADNLDHGAYAVVAEGGYQFTNAPMKPWLRGGLNMASGDGDSTDGNHGTFFNMLPTNHLYYGFADQLALQNLMDWFVQLKFTPIAKTDLNLFLHHFQVHRVEDRNYRGTGAFNRQVFGFPSNPTCVGVGCTGRKNIGTELDIIGTWNAHKHVQIQGGYSFMWGSSIMKANFPTDEDVRFAYVQVVLRYP